MIVRPPYEYKRDDWCVYVGSTRDSLAARIQRECPRQICARVPPPVQAAVRREARARIGPGARQAPRRNRGYRQSSNPQTGRVSPVPGMLCFIASMIAVPVFAMLPVSTIRLMGPAPGTCLRARACAHLRGSSELALRPDGRFLHRVLPFVGCSFAGIGCA
jgi:hypothetical protein